MKKWLSPALAIVCITTIEILAVLKGMDGALLAGTIAIIAGLGGYSIARKL